MGRRARAVPISLILGAWTVRYTGYHSTRYPGYHHGTGREITPPDTPGITTEQAERIAVRTITMLNQKGGVGKTSCTHHLAGALASMGKSVLLLDNDPQSSLSQGFWGPVASREIDPAETIAALYRGDRPFPDQVIKPTGIPGIDLVPGSRVATDFNVPRPHEADEETQHCLRSFLGEVAGSYDLALIDCPPNLHLCSWAALVASDYLIVPLQPEDYGAQGIIDVQESVSGVQAGPNPGLSMLGYLLTMVVPRRSIHQLYAERLKALYGPDVFDATVPEAAVFVEAIARRLPVQQYKPKCEPARAIQALAVELLARVEAKSNASRVEAA
jgi:chromosome partitioning protein